MSAQAARAYLLTGEDTLSRDETVRKLRERMLARPGGELNLAEFHAPDLRAEQLIAACDTLPFLSDRRLVIVHQLFSWRARGGARRRDASTDGQEAGGPLKAERDAFLAYLPRLAPQTTLVLVEGTLSAALQAEIVKQLPPGRADVRQFPAPQGAELERWLMKRARLRGGELGPRVPALLREHGPSSLEALDQEVAKLVTYADGRPVDVGMLNELLSGGELVVFQLLDALAEGRRGDALRSLRRLYQQGQRPEELAPQLIALYRRLLVCRLALAERVDPAEVQRVHGVRLIEKLKTQARRASSDALIRALERLLAFDRRLKRGEIEPETGLELLVTELTDLVAGPVTEQSAGTGSWRPRLAGR